MAPVRAVAVLAVLAMLGLARPGAAAADGIEGIWGVDRNGSPNCSVLVMVLRAGGYTKAMLDIGTTKGLRDSIAGTSTYTLVGDRLEIARSLSLARPEPAQVFRWDPISDILRRERPEPYLTYRRCPDRPLNPMER